MNLSFWKTQKEKEWLVLDIGKESVKSLIFKTEKEKIYFLSANLDYFDDYKNIFFNENEILKEIVGKISLRRNFEKVLISLSPLILKARIISLARQRNFPKEIITKKEAESLEREILNSAKEKLASSFLEEKGIFREEIRFFSASILEFRIDGYPVSQLKDFKGKKINFKVLIVFALERDLKPIEKLINFFPFKEKEIVHLSQSFSNLPTLIPEDRIFLEIGGKGTQFFLIRKGRLKKVIDFPLGGENFSQKISETLGQREREGRELKERYAKGALSIKVKERMSEILEEVKENWYKNLKEEVRKITFGEILPSHFYLFGGGSQLPEIEEILREGDWQPISFLDEIKIEFFCPEQICPFLDLKKEVLPSNILTNPQYTCAFLIFYYSFDYARKNF
jgi:cell division ATPase FtsA